MRWTGERLELQKALEGVGFELDKTGDLTLLGCALDPADCESLDEWFQKMQSAGMGGSVSLRSGKWKVEINETESVAEYKNVHKAIDAAYKTWWKSGRLVNYKNEEYTLEELVEKYG